MEEPEASEKLPTLQEYERKARAIVMRQLAMMDRSRHQLNEAMLRRDIPEEVRENTLRYFEDLGLIDDLHFARTFVRYRFENKGMSRRALARQLHSKGVSEDIVREALEMIDTDSETEAAINFARKRLERGGGNPETLQRRVYAALARRGYSPSICSKAMREAQDAMEKKNLAQDLS